MKKITRSVLFIFILSLILNTAAAASDITINGTAYFSCTLLSKYMEKNGYSFIKEIHQDNVKKNLFAAGDAEVIIKNKRNSIIKTGRTDNLGNFYVSVPGDFGYQIIVRFHGHEFMDVVTSANEYRFSANMGFFDTEEAGSWISKPGLSYCYTCKLRPSDDR
jgi:hypothetical protein